MKHLRLPLAAVFLAAASGGAEAHPGIAHVHSLADGLLHPLTGVDHLLAMVAVGLIAARAAGATRFAAPAGFVLAMAAGAAAGLSGLAIGAAETGIALSLLVLGAIVALARPMPVGAVVAISALSGLVHGIAHGAEAPVSGAGGYLVGMIAMTAVLHAAGYAAGRGAVGRIASAATGLAALGLGTASLAGML